MTSEESSGKPAPAEPSRRGEAAGWKVLHLFCRVPSPGRGIAPVDGARVLEALEIAHKNGHQVITAALTGHKADICVLSLGPDMRVLRQLQTSLHRSGLEISDSYVSHTEVSEYASGVPDTMRQARLYPVLPPDGMPAFCFYPMSKRRSPGAENWYALGFEERTELMSGHGAVGRRFRGRVLQLVTGSTGLDDYEWGVTLFGTDFADLKQCVYEMRFDEASAKYAEFGRFFTGTVGEPTAVIEAVGIS